MLPLYTVKCPVNIVYVDARPVVWILLVDISGY